MKLGQAHPAFALPYDEAEVSTVMTAGCVSISEGATVADASRAVDRRALSAILVLEELSAAPLGWATTDDLAELIQAGRSDARVGEAVTEELVSIAPTSTVHEARRLLDVSQAHRLAVRRGLNRMPEAVVSELDLATGQAR